MAQFPDTSRLNPLIDLYRQAWEGAGVRVLRHRLYPASRRRPALPLSWVLAHRNKVDVLHLHWHQQMYLRDRRVRTILAACRFVCSLAVARFAGMRVTWTAHNLVPHERRYEAVDRAVRRVVTALTAAIFADSAAIAGAVRTAFPRCGPVFVVPQGHFRDVYGEPIPPEKARERLSIPRDRFVYLYFGLMRPYKGVEDLVEAYSRVATSSTWLVLAGEPFTQDLRDYIVERLGSRSDVTLLLDHAPHDLVPALFGASDVVVLPFREIFTSSTKIVAHSLERCVITPRGAAPIEGEEAFNLHYGEVADLPSALSDAMSVEDWPARNLLAKRAALARDWNDIGSTMAQVFASVTDDRRRTRDIERAP